MSDAAIGVFDSGVGGLTAARAIIDRLPHERLLYLADTANVPYGPKPLADIRKYALDCLDRLVDEGVKLLVIACNSAAAACLHDARERYPVPIVEAIRPAVRRAVGGTRNGHVGVVGTRATITSRAYDDAFAAAPQITVTSVACPLLVEFVERGVTSGQALLEVARDYLAPLRAAGVDTLVLGCTHYPVLADLLRFIMGEDVTLVSSADEIATDVCRALAATGTLREPGAIAPAARHRFLATDDPAAFGRLAASFFGSADRVELVGSLLP
ncbi:glutamate racemase [Micromonospora sp. LOL_024]|uniref:glutamate racemase n=1 Tax=Micromonospora sp. LOL_024 TaxID=3345412 RepID=UPI003A88EF02